jgi:CubicO group peptidase (beta-lactamase class C family)
MPATIISGSDAEAVRVSVKRLELLDKFMQQVTDDGTHPASAIRVLRYGTEIFSGAYGVSAPGGPPLTADGIFELQSVTKSVTVTLLALLQEDGALDFCDRLSRYFPEFTGGKKDQIEIWQLLSHSSGMSDEAMSRYVDSVVCAQLGRGPDDKYSHEEYIQAILRAREALGLPKAEPGASREQTVQGTAQVLRLRAPLGSDPRTVFDYCSTGYRLLYSLIERLTGESPDSYAKRRLFEPLGMADTYFILPRDKWPRVVKRPDDCYNAKWLNSESTLSSASGAGGLKSTMYDMTLFGQMYLQEGTLGSRQLLSPATIRVLTANHNIGLPDCFYFGKRLGAAWGLGWHVRYGKKDDLGLLRSDRTFDHGGAGGARLFVDPDSGLVFSLYMVDREDAAPYSNHSRVANIIYSALR